MTRRHRSVRNALMDAGSWLLWKVRLHGTRGSFDAWCDQHGRWDK